MQPIHERGGTAYFTKLYEGRKDLGNTQPGDGALFHGRGKAMITGRRNYVDWSERLGIDLVAAPDRVLDPDISARVLVEGSMLGTFTGKKLGNYITDAKCDFVNSRRVINGLDDAETIAGYADNFLSALA